MSTQLAPLEIGPRLARLRGALHAAGCDALVVTDRCNVRYLTGFTGSSGLVVVTADDAVLVTDGRYAAQAPAQLAEAGVEVSVEVAQAEPEARIAAVVAPGLRVGLEAASVSWATQRSFATRWLADRELVPTEHLVEQLRMVKDAGEVARITAAASIADRAFTALRPALADGPAEREVALELDAAMRRLGASDRAFETIVASGPNGASPHARPGERRIRPGDLVVVDFGAVVEGYRSDMTRTVMIGDPNPTQRRLLDVVTQAQAAGVAAVGVDVACRDVDAACREVLAEAGWGDRFVHGSGHGVGLEIHEAPWVNSRSAATLTAGHVVTVEPGAYLPSIGGVRVEDTVVVTEAGAERVTRAPKDPILA